MKQDFNLLGAAPRSTQRSASTNVIASVAGAVLAIGLAAGFWLDWRADAAEKRIELANLAIEDLVLNLQERSQFLAQRNADPTLVTHLQQLERETNDKGKVLDLLSGKTLGNTAGFSEHLAALGRRHPAGLWLRHVQLSDGGRQMQISGRATDPALVPRFIEELRSEPSFSGSSFQRFELTHAQAGGGPVSFTLATACEPAADATDAAEDCFSALPETSP